MPGYESMRCFGNARILSRRNWLPYNLSYSHGIAARLESPNGDKQSASIKRPHLDDGSAGQSNWALNPSPMCLYRLLTMFLTY